ncbi:hypothetical protein V5O48_017316 [Marasmius crinis-equi]|uniref:Uncharacterized protein n=1 Tax=Marasmius crinis-equi TaxID=585013 RepID=A0ABR3EPI6_9AGAR
MSTGLPKSAATSPVRCASLNSEAETIIDIHEQSLSLEGRPLRTPEPVLTPYVTKPGSQEDEYILPPPPTPLYLARDRRRMTPDVPVDLDELGNSLKISRWKGV